MSVDDVGHEGHAPAPAPGPPHARAPRRRFAFPWGSLLLIVVAAIAGILLYRFVFDQGRGNGWLGPLAGRDASNPAGVVEIDSPEIYTRERLVNDRFIEDNWLKTLLSNASARSYGPSLAVANSRSRSAFINLQINGESGDAAGAAEGAAAQAEPGLPSDSNAILDNILAFRAEQFYRQTIRQAIIENQLDDRHDLQGNSLYLFKFDASVLPGEANAHALRIDMVLSNQSNVHDEIPIDAFINRKTSGNQAIADADHLYGLWLEGTNAKLDRLRGDLRQAFKRNIVGETFSDDVKARFKRRFGITLASTATDPASLLAALKEAETEIIAEVNRTSETYYGASQALGGLNAASVNNCEVIDLVPEGAVARALQVSELSTNAPSETALYRGLSLSPPPAPIQSAAARESNAVLESVAKCLAEAVLAEWAIRINFGDSSTSSPGMRTVWDYVTPAFRQNRTVELRPRVDHYFASYSNVMEKCSASDACRNMVGSNYALIDVVDLSNPATADLGGSLAKAAEREGCSGMQPPDSGNPGTLLIYSLSSQQGRSDVVGSAGASAVPLEAAALRGLLDSGSYLCSPPALELQGFHLSFERGLYDFIARIREESRSYSYSVMPREDLQIVARDFDGSRGFQGTGAAPGLGAGISEQRSQTARTVEGDASIVGFGSSKSVAASGQDEPSVEFGWIVWPRTRLDGSGGPVQEQIPMQRSLSALVSIPAWWEHVHIGGNYAWLDENGDVLQETAKRAAAEQVGAEAASDGVGNAFEYDIALPFDIATLDPVLFGRGRLADPKMFDWGMGDISLRMCEPASVIIPGQRLWRSAVVTIGSQSADEIIVLPNMEGIIARFRAIEFPNGAGEWQAGNDANTLSDADRRLGANIPVVLTVWTSEGSVSYNRPVTLLPPRVPTSVAANSVGSCSALRAMADAERATARE